MKKIITFFLLGIACTTLYAQQISNMRTRFTGSNVEVTYTLTTTTPGDIELLYSIDKGKTYHTCLTVKGDLQSQTSGNKKISWECAEDGIIMADVVLKLNFIMDRETDLNYKITGDIKIETVFVEGGTFMMGCTAEQGNDCHGDEKPVHQVTINSFYIGKYEVTQGQWKAVMGNNPSYFAKGDNYPVENVSWDDAQEFIRQLNIKTGKNYRLPTEAEWEYAARGGKQSKGYKYSGGNDINVVAWYNLNSSCRTQPVGTKAPNELGIYDMSGNVWEWCNDWYGDYSSNAQTAPRGPSSGSARVFRGGSWHDDARYARVSFRNGITPGSRYSHMGFRLACSSK